MKNISRSHWQLNDIEIGRKYVRMYGTAIDKQFKIDQDNSAVIDSLIQYFNGDPSFTLPGGYSGDLDKGILLIGATGTGKTFLMNLFSQYVTYDRIFFMADGKKCPMTFPIVRTEKVVNDFAQYGQEEVERYSKRRIICFDDLGEEPKEAVHFGTRINVLQQILEERCSRSCITLATTNHKIGELGKMYGPRLASRIPEMFNPIAIKGADRRALPESQRLNFKYAKKE